MKRQERHTSDGSYSFSFKRERNRERGKVRDISGAFFSLSLSFSLSFCCFDLVLKFPCDFGISFPCFREFTEYPRSVLGLKSSRVLL